MAALPPVGEEEEVSGGVEESSSESEVRQPVQRRPVIIAVVRMSFFMGDG